MRVEVWSDVVCPWCYIGKRRLETALARWGSAGADVELVWRSFQLDPRHPVGARESHDPSLARKYGVTLDEVRAMNDRVIALAAAEGLAYDFERYQVINTFDAHRLAHLAAGQGLGTQMVERLMRGQLEEGELLDDPDTLVRLAAEVGVPEATARAVVQSDAYADAVTQDLQQARDIGVRGVPFFLFDGRFAVSGAQPVELLERALALAAEDGSVGERSA